MRAFLLITFFGLTEGGCYTLYQANMVEFFENQIQDFDAGEVKSSAGLSGANIEIMFSSEASSEILASEIRFDEYGLRISSDIPIHEYVIGFAEAELSYSFFEPSDELGDPRVGVTGEDAIELGQSPYSILKAWVVNDDGSFIGSEPVAISIEEYSEMENLPDGAFGYEMPSKYLRAQTLSIKPDGDHSLNFSSSVFRQPVIITSIGIVIPEPSSSILLLSVIAMLVSRRRRFQKVLGS